MPKYTVAPLSANSFFTVSAIVLALFAVSIAMLEFERAVLAVVLADVAV